MSEHLIAVGIGGTGAKCIEALGHLAASGHASSSIYPILIDQDGRNGNVDRCKNSLKSYMDIREIISEKREWFFKPTFDLYDKLLPLLPQEDSKNYGAAIGLPSMSDDEASVVRSLFLPSQLNEELDSGYKKRAHMGSVLIQQLLDRENQKPMTEIGLNFIIDKVIRIEKPQVVIFGSLFGGTGAAGLVRIGKYFKEKMPHAVIKGVFLTPYFIVGCSSETDIDGSLVKSDSDMQAVKIALQMYKEEIEESFHNIFVIGSSINELTGEFVSKKPSYGGKEQKNPSHIFEMIAATVPLLKYEETHNEIYSFICDTKKVKPPLFIALNPNYPTNSDNCFNSILSDSLINTKRLILSRDFAHAIYRTQDHDEDSWWRRQPWYDSKFKIMLINWAVRHYKWWKEIDSDEWEEHRWSKFALHLDTQIDEYSYSSMLSKHIGGDSPNDLGNVFKTVDILNNQKLRRLKWASI